jgi:hypothetical protein
VHCACAWDERPSCYLDGVADGILDCAAHVLVPGLALVLILSVDTGDSHVDRHVDSNVDCHVNRYVDKDAG